MLPPGKRHSLFSIAFKFFPTAFLVKSIALTVTTFPLILNYLKVAAGIESIVTRTLLTGCIVGLTPTLALYLITLARAPRIRKREEIEEARLQHIAHGDLEALHVMQEKEEREIVRREEVATGDRTARIVKDKKEDERWDLLNESLRLQKETVELATEERLLVAQQVKEIKDEGEIMRKGLVSDDLEARHVKDLKEDKRWDLLNESLRLQKVSEEFASEERLLVAQQVKDVKDEREVIRIGLALDDLKARDRKDRKEDERWEMLNESLRLQKETVELATEERLLVAQQVKDIKDEGEVMRKGLASDDLESRHIKEAKEEKRWDALYERLRVQDQRSEEREQRHIRFEEEQQRMHHEDGVKDTYRILFERFVRNATENPLYLDVANGLSPIPLEWLQDQPEIRKNPALLQSLIPHNER